MKRKRNQTIKDGVYSVELKFSAYGRQDIKPNQEKEIVENYNVGIEMKNIKFEGYFTSDGKNVREVTEPTIIQVPDPSDPLQTIDKEVFEGDLVKLYINDEFYPLNEKFEMAYSVKVSSIKDNNLGTHLKTKEDVCNAMCQLFGNRIDEEIAKVLDEAIAKTGDFESEDEKTL